MNSYNAKVIKIIEGDTLVLDIDLGFHLKSTRQVKVRFLDTPELFSGLKEEREEGRRARSYAAQLLVKSGVTIVTYKDPSQGFNCHMVDIFISDRGYYDGINFATLMVLAGHEKLPEYGGKPAKYFNVERREANLLHAGASKLVKGVE